MKSLFKTIYIVLIVALAGVGVLFMGTLVPVLGYEAKVVKSGSMEPSIPVGALVLIHKSSEYKVGDVITFGQDTKVQIPTTHRIAKIEDGNYTTKGDANDDVDQTTTRQGDIIGKVIFSAPYMGYLLAFARTLPGFLLLVGVPALMVMVEEGYTIIHEVMALRRKKRGDSATPDGGTSFSMPLPPYGRVVENVVPVRRMIMDVRRIPVTHIGPPVIGLMLLLGLHSAGEHDTISYFQDRESSVNNIFQAASEYPIPVTETPVTFSLSAFSFSESTDATPPEGGPPPEDTPPVDEGTPPADPPQDNPQPEVTVVTDPPVVDEPPADNPPPPENTPPADPPPADSTPPADPLAPVE